MGALPVKPATDRDGAEGAFSCTLVRSAWSAVARLDTAGAEARSSDVLEPTGRSSFMLRMSPVVPMNTKTMAAAMAGCIKNAVNRWKNEGFSSACVASCMIR